MGQLRKAKTPNIAKFHRTDLVIWSHSIEVKPSLVAKEIWYIIYNK